jgi:hypothetical protein
MYYMPVAFSSLAIKAIDSNLSHQTLFMNILFNLISCVHIYDYY